MSSLTQTIHTNIKNNTQISDLEDISLPAPKKTKTIKEKFQEKYELYQDKQHFLVGLATPLFEENNAEVFIDLLPGISDIGFQIAIRANASQKYKNIIQAFNNDHPGVCCLVPEADYDEMFDAIDGLLVLTRNSQIEHQNVIHSLKKGVIPITPSEYPLEMVENYNPNLESGNSFVYYRPSEWSIFAALVRAYETYRFPYDWKNIIKYAKDSVR